MTAHTVYGSAEHAYFLPPALQKLSWRGQKYYHTWQLVHLSCLPESQQGMIARARCEKLLPPLLLVARL